MTFLLCRSMRSTSCLRRCWQVLPPPAALTARSPAHSPVPLFLSCWRWRPPLLDRPWPACAGARGWQKISYAVFLVHHVLIQDMAAHFDLAALSRRDTAFLYVVYLAAAFAAAEALLWLQKTLRRAFAALRPV